MRFYNPGDEIYMFGFSRGAYIARFLAEMIDYIGLLSHGNEEMVKFAWKAFSQWQCRSQSNGSEEEVAASHAEKRKMFEFMKGFRETFSRPVGRIRFLGLFDTVNSVPQFETAWMQRSKSPYTARTSAKVIRHAVSIDERRAKFRQDLMYQGNPKTKNRRHKHLGDFFQWDAWGRPVASAVENAADKAKPPSRPDEEEKKQQSQPNGQHANKRISQDAPQHPRPSADRGRAANRFLQPDAQSKNVPADEGSYAPYRARSTSRQRMHSQAQKLAGWKLKSGHQQQQHPNNADAMSEMSGISPSDIDPDWDDDGQDIDEVWFSGGHGDVGGGWEMLENRKSASHVPLAWIVREAMRAGLPFDAEKVKQLGCACSTEWDASNPAKVSAAIKKQKKEQRQQGIPDIRLQNGNSATTPTFPESPTLSRNDIEKEAPPHDYHDDDDDDDDDDEDKDEKLFHGLMHLAHTAPIHDSLSYGGGLPFLAVTAWKMMEWMPFARMDLQADGSWKPIRWPLPRGEVRDIPNNVRVHGSVIRRMKYDVNYRPGNLIVGGGGRGVRRAPEEYGIGEWVCVDGEGDPIGEIWMKKTKPENSTT
jgi:uncharacterized protein (DUF2235 family)